MARVFPIRYRALAWLITAAGLAYLCRNAIGVAESTIRNDLNLSVKESGMFMGAFFWTYACFQIPTGSFAQRMGARVTLTLFAALWSTATLGIAFAPGFWMLIVAQLLMGIAQAGIFPASCQSIGHWMPLSQRAIGCGLLAAGMQVGAVLASGLTGELIAPLGWRIVFVVYSVPCFLWAAAFFIRFCDRPEAAARMTESELALIRGSVPDAQPRIRDQTAEQPGDEITTLSWWTIARSRTVWFLCGQQTCRAAGYMFFASWFPTFLQQTRGISVRDSGYLQGLVLAGTLAGGIGGGWIADWILRRTGNLSFSRSGLGGICLAVCGLLILAAWFVASVPIAVGLLAIGSLFAALAGPGALSTTIDIGGKNVPQIFGLMNMTGNFAAAACPVIVGWLFDWTSNWDLVLLLFAALYLVGAVCWLFVDPRKPLFD